MATLIHEPETLREEVLLPDKVFVELQDPPVTFHRLGPRYALVQNATARGRQPSYAMLNLPGTAYELIIDHNAPQGLGTLQQFAPRRRVRFGDRYDIQG